MFDHTISERFTLEHCVQPTMEVWKLQDDQTKHDLYWQIDGQTVTKHNQRW